MPRDITHWGAPFGGRSKELSLLLHLIQEGLAGELSHVAVRGRPGVGRRRLLREAFRRGPWAEWMDLSPGCVTLDLPRWTHGELTDFLDAYPHASIPGWSLAHLARLNPRLRRYAAQPVLSPAGLGRTPEDIAEALAAVAYALAAYAPIVIHAALEPATDSWEGRLFHALRARLREPGVVLVSGGPPLEDPLDPPYERSLALEPHTLAGVRDIAAHWFGEGQGRDVASWLLRASGGNAFAMSEILRWLEESGCLRVDASRGRMVPVVEVSKFPVPLNLRSIMQTRWEHLSLGARYVFHHIVSRNGELTQEQLLETYDGRDGDRGFHEALAVLRRRSFLYRSTYRHPLAASSLLWSEISEEPSKRKFKRAKSRSGANGVGHTHGRPSTLAQTQNTLERLHRTLRNSEAGDDVRPPLARVLRLARRRVGPAWDGVWGRAALLAAVWYTRKGDGRRTQRWCRRGRDRLNPEVFPGLRRSLGRIETRVLRGADRMPDATALTVQLRREALWAGHVLAARSLDTREHPVLDRVPARLRVFGGRGLYTSAGYKPFSLFPEWWRQILALGVSRSLLGEHPREEELAEAYSASEPGAPWDAEAVVLDFNRLLFTEHRGGGGYIWTGGHALRWSFTDIWCDARELMALPEAPSAFSRAGGLAFGVYFPGVHHPTVERARETLRNRVLSLFALGPEPLTAEDYHAWVEGPARMAGGRELLAAMVRRAGKPQLAQALSAGSPEGTD